MKSDGEPPLRAATVAMKASLDLLRNILASRDPGEAAASEFIDYRNENNIYHGQPYYRGGLFGKLRHAIW